jgi:hypothetical protein
MPKLDTSIQTPFGKGDLKSPMSIIPLFLGVVATFFLLGTGQRAANKLNGAFGGRVDTSPEFHQYTQAPTTRRIQPKV